MHKILVADIFGKTPSLEELAGSLGNRSEIIDPYFGQVHDFKEETEAYAYFQDKVGLGRYADFLHARLQPMSTPLELIGFSVGASAIWKISHRLNPQLAVRAVCFYGSQIRHHQEINPCIHIDLILPDWEPGFDVTALAQKLSAKPTVNIDTSPYRHGFMNPHSNNYDRAGYDTYVDWLRGGKRNEKTGHPDLCDA